MNFESKARASSKKTNKSMESDDIDDQMMLAALELSWSLYVFYQNKNI